MTVAAYAVEHLNVALDGRKIVEDVSFTIEPGTSMAVIGPNGAGKSTLVKCLLRLLPATSGRVRLFGKEIARYNRRALARVAGYVPQAGEGNMPFTVEEFVLMARYPYLGAFSHFTDTDRRVAQDAMAHADVASLAKRMLYTLSGGERQKVYIAAALAQRPLVMLLDEATAFLDYRHQVEILELTEKLRHETGMTVIAVTHDLNQGLTRYDHVLALKEGAVAYWGPPRGLLEAGRLEQIYDTPFRFHEDPGTGAVYVMPGERQP
ncbi:MAG: ABC transporter ATP-binding protein [Candidatus Hydrogenedentes bacterium]|jgi:iron complex transport system ATP-binding protein|nr:ABC transporter ATP-binding protein [Candidatus Hydrogenedentota bacterium]